MHGADASGSGIAAPLPGAGGDGGRYRTRGARERLRPRRVLPRSRSQLHQRRPADLLYRRISDLQQASGRAGAPPRCSPPMWKAATAKSSCCRPIAPSAARSPPLSARRIWTNTSRAGLLLFTGDVYEQLIAQMANNPANRKAPEMAPVLDEQWSPVLRNLGVSYQVRLTLDLMGGAARARPDVRRACSAAPSWAISTWSTTPTTSSRFWRGNWPPRQDRLYFDTWTSFPSQSSRKNPAPKVARSASWRLPHRCHRGPDLTLNVTTRVKVKVNAAIAGRGGVRYCARRCR